MPSMKTVYENGLGERVILKRSHGHLIINVKDETGDEAEICIPIEYAVHIAHCIISECNNAI